MLFIFFYIIVGALAGILAGLLGIGGGLVIVPMLSFAFAFQDIPNDHILHLSLGTSLASILFTSVASMRSHNQRGAVIWPVVKRIAPGILFGTFLGTWIASLLSTNFLRLFFSIFLLYTGTQMILGIKPNPSRQLPATFGMFSAGGLIGIFSSLVGIGGGTLSVPFLTWCNIKIHKSIGTSAAIGFPIAIAGTIGYILNGLNISNIPASCIGFIHIKSLSFIVLASVLTAPIGAKLAHSINIDKLKKIFAILLYFVGIRMLFLSL